MSLYQSNAVFKEMTLFWVLPPFYPSELHPAKKVLKGPVTSGGGVISRELCRQVIVRLSILKLVSRCETIAVIIINLDQI